MVCRLDNVIYRDICTNLANCLRLEYPARLLMSKTAPLDMV